MSDLPILNIPGVTFLGKDKIVLSVMDDYDTPAVRYRLLVNGRDVQIIVHHDDWTKKMDVFVDGRLYVRTAPQIVTLIRGLLQ